MLSNGFKDNGFKGNGVFKDDRFKGPRGAGRFKGERIHSTRRVKSVQARRYKGSLGCVT